MVLFTDGCQVRIPLYGCDCYAYGLLAAGFCDLVVEADMKPYDFLALVPIVEGAGGLMTDWKVSPARPSCLLAQLDRGYVVLCVDSIADPDL